MIPLKIKSVKGMFAPWPLLMVVLLGCLEHVALGASEKRRPNVLFIIVDDLRNELGCYGCAHIHSPNIDRLAGRGLRFDNAYVQATFCNPSRTSFLTGLRPGRTGIMENRTYYREKLPDRVTLPQFFRKNGYITAGFGKIFHGHDAADNRATWDVTAGMRTTPAGRRGEGRNLTGGEVPWCSWRASEGKDADQPDGQIAGHAVRFLKGRPKEKPFFLAVGFLKPHDPFVAPKKYFDHYPPGRLQLPMVPADRSPSAIMIRGWKKAFDRFTDTERMEFLRAYCACISFVDAQVGKVLETLDRLGLREETIVCFLGDHGYHLGEHDWWNKNTLYEFSCRTPLVLSVPGMKTAGRGCRALVEFVDIYPTLAELCGLSAPGDLDGRDFSVLLSNPEIPWKDAAYSQYGNGATVRNSRWRYMRWRQGSKQHHALFDCIKDPGEYYNLVDKPGKKEVVATLEILLKKTFPQK